MKQIEYIIQSGDTIFNIGLKFNLSTSEIVSQNNLPDPDLIYPGEKLMLNVSEEFYNVFMLGKSQCSCEAVPATASVEALPRGTFKRHKIRRGDTVYMLAREYGTTTGNILALNPQIKDVRNIQIGSVITIPLPPENSYIYVVRPGDTVYSIAKSQGVSEECIMQHNFIDNDASLYPGQQLILTK